MLLGEDVAGHPALREAIAEYLAAARGVGCTAEQVIIVSGIRQALAVAARLLLDPGDRVWLENPGYPGLRGPLVAAGAKLVPVEVDSEGLSLRLAERSAARPRLICIAPSHQYPLGMTMSVARRLALLDYARQVNAWVFEDDYDSEWRYAGRPLAAMQGLDRDGRVLYAGTFSKILFPSIRLGYIVLPAPLVAPFLAARQALDDQPAVLAQPALAAFIAGGHLASHLRRQRRRYKARQELLLAAARRHLDGLLEVGADPGGMHLIGYLHPGLAGRMDDREASRRAAAAGIAAPALSSFWIGRAEASGSSAGLHGRAGAADRCRRRPAGEGAVGIAGHAVAERGRCGLGSGHDARSLPGIARSAAAAAAGGLPRRRDGVRRGAPEGGRVAAPRCWTASPSARAISCAACARRGWGRAGSMPSCTPTSSPAARAWC